MMRPLALIIAADPNLARVFEEALTQAKFETVLDADGNNYARLLTSDTQPAILILDLHFPFASGKKFLSELRANPTRVKLPAIIVTAHRHLAQELQSEGEKVLLKPVSTTLLIDSINSLLGNITENEI